MEQWPIEAEATACGSRVIFRTCHLPKATAPVHFPMQIDWSDVGGLLKEAG